MRGTAIAAFMLLLAVPVVAGEKAGISGDYVEIRTADVFTGPCFANGEVGLTGREAVLAWRVREGSWDGVRLDGLSVLAVVHAAETLGDMRERQAVPWLAGLRDHPVPRVRANTLLALCQLGDGLAHEELVGLAANELLSDRMRISAAWALQHKQS